MHFIDGSVGEVGERLFSLFAVLLCFLDVVAYLHSGPFGFVGGTAFHSVKDAPVPVNVATWLHAIFGESVNKAWWIIAEVHIVVVLDIHATEATVESVVGGWELVVDIFGFGWGV